MINNLDYFIAFIVFLIIYGTFFKIWNTSRTTIIVILFVFVLAVLAKFKNADLILFVTALFMFLLFVRAVFRDKIRNSKYKDVFYA